MSIILILPFSLYAEDNENSPSGCNLLYPTLYSITLFIPGLIMLNLFIEPDETWHPFSFDNFLSAFGSPPEDDKDSWIFNFVLHPLWGSETYLRARTNGCNWWQSWLFSNAMSILWEYGFESWNEHPSLQDLLITGNIGSIIGEARYFFIKKIKKIENTGFKYFLLFTLDPIQTTIDCIFN